MDNMGYSYPESHDSTRVLDNSFVANVFIWMFAALGTTALVAYLFGSSPKLFMLLINENGSMSVFGWVVMLAPLAIVLLMSARIEKMKASTMILLYVVYSVLMGVSLSFIFLAYTSASIFKTFIIAAGMFAIMAVLGYTTSMDLSKMGSILIMALIGVIIATLVNFFMHSETLDYVISIAGVIIFTGLTAYDMQKIRQIGQLGIDNDESMTKIAVHSALSLYLDFLNLFLYLLRLFGRRR